MKFQPYCDDCLDTMQWCAVEQEFFCDCPVQEAKREAARQENEDMEHDRQAA
ncbi:hypothetical protein [Mesorhizobium sp. Cs1299R1N3]|uniref:hypothetical protein n=1 Tax=Mesorhizobium sp. Cs1299R1N3 TaxID=3015173 RepID=UPI00301DEA6E